MQAADEARIESSAYPIRNGLIFQKNVIILERALAPEILLMLETVVATAPPTTDGLVWVTDGWRPDPNSKHYYGEAFDIRIKNVKGFDIEKFSYSKIVARWAENLQRKLGPDYDVVYGGDHLNHIHVEFDAK